MRDENERLRDILEAIERIERQTIRGEVVFRTDELLQVWVVHNLEIIGEAARNFSDAFRLAHPDIPWSNIVGMRNILIHRYFDIDLDAVWSVVANDLLPLKQAIQVAIQP